MYSQKKLEYTEVKFSILTKKAKKAIVCHVQLSTTWGLQSSIWQIHRTNWTTIFWKFEILKIHKYVWIINNYSLIKGRPRLSCLPPPALPGSIQEPSLHRECPGEIKTCCYVKISRINRICQTRIRTLLYPSLCWNDAETDQYKEPMIDTKII